MAGTASRTSSIWPTKTPASRCPAGETLTHRWITHDKGRVLRKYGDFCPLPADCALKAQCTAGKERVISRWEHEAVLENVQSRLDHNPDAMRVRRSTAEHPFGTMKCWMGVTHFLTMTLPKVATEMALNVLAYNMKRVITIIGVDELLDAMAGIWVACRRRLLAAWLYLE